MVQHLKLKYMGNHKCNFIFKLVNNMISYSEILEKVSWVKVLYVFEIRSHHNMYILIFYF